MLVIFGMLIFFPLVIGTIVSAISENPLLRCSMYILAISPLPLLCLICAIAAKRWDYFFDKDFYFVWGALIFLHIVIRFVARTLFKWLTK